MFDVAATYQASCTKPGVFLFPSSLKLLLFVVMDLPPTSSRDYFISALHNIFNRAYDI